MRVQAEIFPIPVTALKRAPKETSDQQRLRGLDQGNIPAIARARRGKSEPGRFSTVTSLRQCGLVPFSARLEIPGVGKKVSRRSGGLGRGRTGGSMADGGPPFLVRQPGRTRRPAVSDISRPSCALRQTVQTYRSGNISIHSGQRYRWKRDTVRVGIYSGRSSDRISKTSRLTLISLRTTPYT